MVYWKEWGLRIVVLREQPGVCRTIDFNLLVQIHWRENICMVEFPHCYIRRGGRGGGRKSRRMSNGADRRGGGSKHTGLLFYRTFHLGGTISPTPSVKCVMVLSIPPAAEAKSL